MNISAEILSDLQRLSGTGVAVVIATCDRDRVPELSRAWGMVLSESGDTIDVCVYAGSGARTLSNLANHIQVAVTMTSPSTYRSLQIKGRAVRTLTASQEDIHRVSTNQRAFVDEVASLGIPREGAERFCEAEGNDCPDLVTISIHIESVFDQTPGPGAGARV